MNIMISIQACRILIKLNSVTKNILVNILYQHIRMRGYEVQ